LKRTTIQQLLVPSWKELTVDEETDDVKICSMEQLGYVECIEDEENPEKCNVSWAFPRVLRPSLFIIVILTLIITLFQRI